MKHHWSYKSLKNRNRMAKKLKAAGHQVRRYSLRNQLVHPQYIEDEANDLKGQTGFGNQVYKTHYPVIYIVEVI
jgi:hypothetical protein